MSEVEEGPGTGALVVAPVGDIDLTNANELRTAILCATSSEGTAVIVDLSGVRYLDSLGIRVLFSVARRLRERRKRLLLVTPADAHLRRLLAIVDIESCASVHETVEAARRHGLQN